MKVLVIGSGGREHAIAWCLSASKNVTHVYVAPGNAGTLHEQGVSNVPITAPEKLADFALQEGIKLTVVGPEAPLAAGIVDLFQNRGLAIFGPVAKAAQLEASKDFAKQFMLRHGIPTAASQTFSDAKAAQAYLDGKNAPIVIKADGLAAGKGVVVATSMDEARSAVTQFLSQDTNDKAAKKCIVIEEFITGEEASFIVMVDGKNVLPLATSQDHKRVGDGDTGPNTGGMGAYSPAPVITSEIHEKIMQQVIFPTVEGMAAEGIPYHGFLYAGLMIGQDQSLNVLEFNCRMGDPETQPILLRLKTDLFELLQHAVEGTLDQTEAKWDARPALGVVMAASNYPGTPRVGDEISGLPKNQTDLHVFHAGTTTNKNEQVVTAGGRVLCVAALGKNIQEAKEHAYKTCAEIHWDGAFYRTDIGFRVLE